MHPMLKTMLDTGRCERSNGNFVPIIAQISRQEGEFLQTIIRQLKPVVSLEIGLAFGVSALFICEALSEAATPQMRHIVIDRAQMHEPVNGQGLCNLKQAGYEPLIEFHHMDSQRALPQLEASGRSIDFAFVDGAHTFDHCLVDFFYIDRMLRVGGIVAFDDVGFPSIRKVVRFIVTNRNYRVVGHLRWGQPYHLTLGRRLLVKAASSSSRVRGWLKPEVLHTDAELQIISHCVALQKESGETRRFYGSRREWDHVDF
jgi:predicted O-methyltransferase YrrM